MELISIEFNNATMSVCEKNTRICIDLAKELTFEDEDFYDGAHDTPQGAKKIGRYLYNRLQNVL